FFARLPRQDWLLKYLWHKMGPGGAEWETERHASHRHLPASARRQGAPRIAEAPSRRLVGTGHPVRDAWSRPEPLALYGAGTRTTGRALGSDAGHRCRGSRFSSALLRPNRGGRPRQDRPVAGAGAPGTLRQVAERCDTDRRP